MEYNVRLPNISPEVSANIFSKLFFWWIFPFMRYASSHTLQIRDVYDIIENDSAAQLTEQLDIKWKQEMKFARIKNKNPSFTRVLFYTFGKLFFVNGSLLFIQSVFIRFLQPIVLAEYIKHFEEKAEENVGWYLGAGIIILAFLNTFLYHHTFIGCSMIGMRARTATSSLIQQKVTRLSQYSLNRTSPSCLVKLLTEDVMKIEAAAAYFHYLYITPIQFITSAYVLASMIGVASLAGLIFMILVVQPLGYISTLQKNITDQLSILTTKRVSFMKEILYGIRIIKTYGWEKPFEKIIEIARQHELDIVSKQIYTKCVSVSAQIFTRSVAVFLTLTTHVLLGNSLHAYVVFAVISIFHNLEQYLCYFLPEAIERYVEAKSAVSRIETFLTLEEKEEQLKIISYTKEKRVPGSILITNASAKWGSQPVLHDINSRIDSGQLYCIIGPTASGKTSFLKMILNEVTPISGRVDVRGTISYASQKPWLFPSTVKSNILCGQPYNRHKYREIIRICALDSDFQNLPYGDRVSVTDKRVADNEAVKEKISLARTIYKEADIYIVDDCLGSLDPQTEKFIFKGCFNEYLSKKTRIFVSDKLHYAKEANVIALESGTVIRTIDREEISEADLKFLNSKISLEKNCTKSLGPKELIEESEIYFNEHEEDLKSQTRNGYFVTLQEFFKASGNKYFVEIVLVLIGLTQTAANVSDIWLVQWISHSPKNVSDSSNSNNVVSNGTSTFSNIYYRIIRHVIYGFDDNDTHSSQHDEMEERATFGLDKNDLYICIYAGCISICIVIAVVRTLLYHTLCMNASRVLHSRMFENVLFSPMKFFEIYPSGQILHRFSLDMDIVNGLPSKDFVTLQMFVAVCGTTLLVLYASPAIILPMVLILVMIYFLMSCFTATIRGLKNLEIKSTTSVNKFLSTLFYGVFTIRSAEAEELMSQTFQYLLDEHTSVRSLVLMCSEFFCFYLDILIILFMAVITCLLVIVNTDDDNSSYNGLAVTNSIILTEILHMGIREYIEVLTKNSTLRRALQYTKLVTENVNQSTVIPKNWPYCGKIVFKNVYVKDNDGSGSYVRNLNIVINPCEKIAVVSKNLEEKWTIANCLSRLVPSEGLILLDDVDICQISLNKLRSAITVISKNPILFSSSIRFNLDPLEYANDEMLWRVLEEVGLKTHIQSLSQTIIDGGSNFTHGQRQLLCLARALLRNSKVVIIETNPVDNDPLSDKLIQKFIRDKLKNVTVITIAYNLEAVVDKDKVLVIEDGKQVEYAHAHDLLQNTDGYLSKLVNETEPTIQEKIRKAAKENFDMRNLAIEFKFS